MSVVRRQSGRRWLVVATGLAVLVALPFVAHVLPVHAASVPPCTLVGRIAASAGQPYQGYAVSTGNAGIPSLPQLDDVTGLFDGDTSLRIWYASPARWRVDTIDLAGERDLYHSTAEDTVWDYGADQLITIVGEVQLRLPRGADLAPPDLARRVLATVRPATPASISGATYTSLPARRVAGLAAAGVRLTPTDLRTTVSHVDMWADPGSGLPLEVDISARGVAAPVLVSRMLDVTLGAPADAVTAVPTAPPGAGTTVTVNPDVDAALRNLGLGDLPDSLGGLARTGGGLGLLTGISAYGTGFAQIVAVSLPRRTGFGAFRAARDVGGTMLSYPGGQAVVVSTPLVSVMVVQAGFGATYIVAGLVGADVLTAVGADLAAFRVPFR